MSIHHIVLGVRELILVPRADVLRCAVPMAAQMNRILLIAAPNAGGDTIFDVKKNGITIYDSPADRPKILAGETFQKSFPTISVDERDIISVDEVTVPAGGTSGLWVIVQLQDSPSLAQYVKDAYNGAINRDPDAGELAAAISDLTAGCSGETTLTTTKVFFDALFTLTEYTDLATSDTVYIEDLYQSVLGRPSDSGGHAFWLNELTKVLDPKTRQQVRDAFNYAVDHVNLRILGWCPNVLPITNAVQIQGRHVNDAVPDEGDILTCIGGELVFQAPTNAIPAISVETGTTYTLDATDNGKKKGFDNGSAITVTVPAGLGEFSMLWVQLGVGAVTFVEDSVAINNRQAQFSSAGQYAAGSLFSVDDDIFVLAGDTAT